jgi:hypothetical protein
MKGADSLAQGEKSEAILGEFDKNLTTIEAKGGCSGATAVVRWHEETAPDQ